MVSIAGTIGVWRITFSLSVRTVEEAATRRPERGEVLSAEAAAALAPAWGRLEVRGHRRRPANGDHDRSGAGAPTPDQRLALIHVRIDDPRWRGLR